jgi:hypothetical protein
LQGVITIQQIIRQNWTRSVARSASNSAKIKVYQEGFLLYRKLIPELKFIDRPRRGRRVGGAHIVASPRRPSEARIRRMGEAHIVASPRRLDPNNQLWGKGNFIILSINAILQHIGLCFRKTCQKSGRSPEASGGERSPDQRIIAYF